MIAERDYDWAALRGAAIRAGKRTDCVVSAVTDPLYILYTSGTAGQPKDILRDNGGHMVARGRAWRGLLGRLGHWMGGWSQLHCLCAVAACRAMTHTNYAFVHISPC